MIFNEISNLNGDDSDAEIVCVILLAFIDHYIPFQGIN